MIERPSRSFGAWIGPFAGTAMVKGTELKVVQIATGPSFGGDMAMRWISAVMSP